LHINISFIEALEQIPTYAWFMKDLLTKNRRFKKEEKMELEVGCSAIIQKSLPKKSRDLRSFILPVTIIFLVSKIIFNLVNIETNYLFSLKLVSS